MKNVIKLRINNIALPLIMRSHGKQLRQIPNEKLSKTKQQNYVKHFQ